MSRRHFCASEALLDFHWDPILHCLELISIWDQTLRLSVLFYKTFLDMNRMNK